MDVVWDAPSADASGSMPLGNGEVGVNAWVEPSGDLRLYLARTDSWSEEQRLLKLGGVRVRLAPNPLAPGAPFRQALRLESGTLEVRIGEVELGLWVDAHRPVVHVEVRSPADTVLEARLEVWRTAARVPPQEESHSRLTPRPQGADTVLDEAGAVVWYHRNEGSAWPESLRRQGLGGAAARLADPLRGRTFGGAMAGPGLERVDPLTLRSRAPGRRHRLRLCLLTAQTPTAAAWRAQLRQVEAEADGVAPGRAHEAHVAWWQAFWERSHVRVTRTAADPAAAAQITRAYALQRWVQAGAGRGAYPIKFNGSLFCVDAEDQGRRQDPDYRRWGGCYWWQNTRLPYWAMAAAGDYDLMRPLFRFYAAALPLAQERNRLWFGTEGAFFPETMTIWGLFADIDYDGGGPAPGQVRNPYIRHIWQVGLELVAMMLDLYDHTGDEAFLAEEVVPMAAPVLRFFDEGFARDLDGKLIIDPAQACETWQEAMGPMPEVAGLHAVLDRLLALSAGTVEVAMRQGWERLRGELPALPLTADGEALAPAQAWVPKRRNVENPELYAVFPYNLYGVGRQRPLEPARSAFARRLARDGWGWQQDGMQAAYLGLADEAASILVANARRRHEGSRFPAFWGPNYDWIPDQCHGANLMSTLQSMLLQAVGQKILVLPAWPQDWEVEFKLRAPRATTVEGAVRGARLTALRVTPAARAADVVLGAGWSPPDASS